MYVGNYKLWFQNINLKHGLFKFMSNLKATKP